MLIILFFNREKLKSCDKRKLIERYGFYYIKDNCLVEDFVLNGCKCIKNDTNEVLGTNIH